MDESLVNRFVEATQRVFETMLSASVSCDAPTTDPRDGSRADVSGIIGFSGGACGAAVLSLPLETAREMVLAFTGESLDPEGPDFADAVGEVANMICGGAKPHLDRAQMTIGCPQVVVGTSHRVQRPSDASSITIPCRSPHGRFSIEISIRGAVPVSAQNERLAAG